MRSLSKNKFSFLFLYSNYQILIFIGFMFTWEIIITLITKILDGFTWSSKKKKKVSNRTITSNANVVGMQKFHGSLTFFSISVFFVDTANSQDSKERMCYTSKQLLPVPENSEIYLQLCIWDKNVIHLIALHVISTILLDNNFPHLESRLWLKVNFVLLVDFMSDLLQQIPTDKWCKRLTNWVSQYCVTHIYL